MTDPLALDPVLPPRERSALAFNDAALDHDERYRHFAEHVTGGGKVGQRAGYGMWVTRECVERWPGGCS